MVSRVEEPISSVASEVCTDTVEVSETRESQEKTPNSSACNDSVLQSLGHVTHARIRSGSSGATGDRPLSASAESVFRNPFSDSAATLQPLQEQPAASDKDPFMPIGSKSTAWRDSLAVAFDEPLQKVNIKANEDKEPLACSSDGGQSPRLIPCEVIDNQVPAVDDPIFLPLNEPLPEGLSFDSFDPLADVETICKNLPDLTKVGKEIGKAIDGSKCKNFFLTGATGFIGSVFLASLLCVTSKHNLRSQYTVHCLVRCANEAEGLERIENSLKYYRLWNPAFINHLKIWPGDLEQACFGLSEERFRELAETVEVIYLAGGVAPSSKPYRAKIEDPSGTPRLINSAYGVSRQIEVLSFATTLRLASTHSRKRINVVSSMAQFPEMYYDRSRDDENEKDDDETSPSREFADVSHGTLVSETTVLKQAELLSRICPHRTVLGGHASAKRAVESIALRANELGFECSIFRFPFAVYATGDMDGMSNPDQKHIFVAFLKAAVQEGAIPALKQTFWSLLLTPIDVACLKMIYTSMLPKPLHRIYHLLNRECEDTTSENFARWATKLGIHLDIVSRELFTEMITSRGPSSPLYPFLEEFEIIAKQWFLTTEDMGTELKPLCNRITSTVEVKSEASPSRHKRVATDSNMREAVLGANNFESFKISDQFISQELTANSSQFIQIVKDNDLCLTQNIQCVSPASEAYDMIRDVPQTTSSLLAWPCSLFCTKALLLSMIHHDFFVDDSKGVLRTVEDCLTYARYATGLFDAGPYLNLCLEGYTKFFEARNKEIRLSFAAQLVVSRSLIVYMQTLLYMTAMEKQHPEILEEKIQAPIFILGLNRAGTTFLHHLLSEDIERFRSPRLCEMVFPYGEHGEYQPVSMANDTPFSTDPRIAPTQDLCNVQIGALMNEKFQSIHRRRSAYAEEDLIFFEILGRSYTLCAGFVVPSYREWLLADNAEQMRKAYPFHKRMMQHLQFQRPVPYRWILKMPFHLLSLQGINDTYPDAEIIFAHRNPVASVASWCGVESFLHKHFIRNHNPHLSGKLGLEIMKRMLDNFMDQQSKQAVDFFCAMKTVQPPASFVLNCYFDDLTSSPISEVRRIYKALGWGNFSLETEQRFWSFLLENLKFRELMSTHQYDLAEVGLSRSMVEEALKEYIHLYFSPEEKMKRKHEFILARQFRMEGPQGVMDMINKKDVSLIPQPTWPASLDQARRNFTDLVSFTKCMITRSSTHRV